MNGGPKFNVGDEVTINFIEGTKSIDYPFGVNDTMLSINGKKAIIIGVIPCHDRYLDRSLSYLHDGYVYKINRNLYSYSSSMFLECNGEI